MVELGSRELCLWASQSPPLTQANLTSQVGTPTSTSSSSQIHSIMGITFVKSLGSVITGGTDMCLRWWDRNNAAESTVLSYKGKLGKLGWIFLFTHVLLMLILVYFRKSRTTDLRYSTNK